MRSCLWGDVEGVAGRALSGWKRLSQRGEERKVEQLVFVILVFKKLRQGDCCKSGVGLDNTKKP